MGSYCHMKVNIRTILIVISHHKNIFHTKSPTQNGQFEGLSLKAAIKVRFSADFPLLRQLCIPISTVKSASVINACLMIGHYHII